MAKVKNNTLEDKSLEELATIRSLATSLLYDFDKNLATYATLNGDTQFLNMPKEIEEQHVRRNKMHGVITKVNAIIEEKLFEYINE